jgi:hypothetical protein
LITLSTTIHTTAIPVINPQEKTDSLSITQNADGTFQMEWDKKDPTWSFLNHLTSKEIQIIMEQALQDKLKSL